jgi:hypothetical protein
MIAPPSLLVIAQIHYYRPGKVVGVLICPLGPVGIITLKDGDTVLIIKAIILPQIEMTRMDDCCGIIKILIVEGRSTQQTRAVEKVVMGMMVMTVRR